ncbi:hypothetical protein DMH02_003310 [Streptomyces sp. WAC 00631]|uniref:hypothetical protein n=1 Tax=Streptomyces sp. WAC 00631 TaxID=2203201 RepID=UPI000F78AAA3|nr:hypothetical protein [Streptomyces sp. WAC 00631]MCC5032305.1 hypothetical protein [Streptomyces sp. WAC 00631]
MSGFTARAGTGLRLVRAAVFAAVCVVLSATGHVLASPAVVPLWALGGGFLAVLVVAAGLAGRERSLPGIAVVLGTGQVLLHTLFGYAQQLDGPAAAPAGGGSPDAVTELAARLLCGEGGHPLSAAEAHRVVTAAGIDPGVHAAAATAGGTGGHGAALPASLLPSPEMLLAHLLAAVLLGLLLRRGEAALFRLVRLSVQGLAEGALVRSLRAAVGLARALLAGLPGAGGPRVRGLRCRRYGPERPRPLYPEHSVSRRGPPDVRLAA